MKELHNNIVMSRREMNRFLFALIFTFAFILSGYAQEKCQDPNFRATFEEKYEEIGASDPEFLNDATVIFYKSYSPRIQWIGLYREGPIRGALLAYDCAGKLLSIQKTGGIKSIQFFNAPSDVSPAVAVEEITTTGTGYYNIDYSVYTISGGSILKIWRHTKTESAFVIPGMEGIIDLFEFHPSGNPDRGLEKITVEGIRKTYPIGEKSDSINYRVEKLPIEYYCWVSEKKAYAVCK
jgi:hypothetical protein